MTETVQVPGGEGRSVTLGAGQCVRIVDVSQDCVVVLSGCPMDIVPISAGGITPLELHLYA